MTFKHNKKIICLILAIAMIFSGMCSNSIKADSILEYINHSDFLSTLDASDDIADYPEYRTEEFSSSRIIANTTKSDRRSEEKNNSYTDLHLSYANILQQNFATEFMTSVCESSENIHSTIVIIKFIHQKDGKK